MGAGLEYQFSCITGLGASVHLNVVWVGVGVSGQLDILWVGAGSKCPFRCSVVGAGGERPFRRTCVDRARGGCSFRRTMGGGWWQGSI